MRMALRNGGLNPEDISYINAHGTSTPQGDIAETQAIKTVFGDHARKLVVSSTKGATGHMLGAAGAVEMIVCIKACKKTPSLPTINQEVPDPECDLDYVPNTARQIKVNAVVNNSFRLRRPQRQHRGPKIPRIAPSESASTASPATAPSGCFSPNVW